MAQRRLRKVQLINSFCYAAFLDNRLDEPQVSYLHEINLWDKFNLMKGLNAMKISNASDEINCSWIKKQGFDGSFCCMKNIDASDEIFSFLSNYIL